MARVQKDRQFRHALLREAVEALLGGELAAGKLVLRDYIKATVGFSSLSKAVAIPEKSLMRMFSASGNPQADKLFRVLAWLQRRDGISLAVRPTRAA